MTTRGTTYGHEGRGESGRSAFFSTAALLLLLSGGTGTAAFLALMRTGHTLWGFAAGIGWAFAAAVLLVMLIGACAMLGSDRKRRRRSRDSNTG